jgi:hypothetical protein
MIHLKLRTRCISVRKIFYFIFLSDPFCVIFLSAGIATSISMRVLFFLNYYIWPICRNSCVCVYQLTP